ncbi:MAG: DUF485 domain-containing protein [Planctomycetaceae bacterium]
MAGFDHGPATPAEPDDPAVSARNARYGLILFAIYFSGYAIFVLINAFWPDVMSRPIGGVTFAVSYGLGLIAAAIVLAFVYSWLCRGPVAVKTEDRQP